MYRLKRSNSTAEFHFRTDAYTEMPCDRPFRSRTPFLYGRQYCDYLAITVRPIKVESTRTGRPEDVRKRLNDRGFLDRNEIDSHYTHHYAYIKEMIFRGGGKLLLFLFRVNLNSFFFLGIFWIIEVRLPHVLDLIFVSSPKYCLFFQNVFIILSLYRFLSSYFSECRMIYSILRTSKKEH